MARDGSSIGEDGNNKDKEVCSNLPEDCNSCPFRIRLTTHHLCWDSLKISPSKEFEEHILGNMNEASRKALKHGFLLQYQFMMVTPVKRILQIGKERVILVQTNTVFLWEAKKGKNNDGAANLLWFGRSKERVCLFDWAFRQVVSKRNLKYNQEIGLRWSGWALWKRSTYFSIWNWLNLILQQVNANAWNA